MSSTKGNLERQLWAVADELRGTMDASEYRSYALGVIFYKYLSEREESVLHGLIDDADAAVPLVDIWDSPDYEGIDEEVADELGFAIHPRYLYSSLLSEIDKGTKGEWSVDLLQRALNELADSTSGRDSSGDFKGLFSDVNLNSPALGKDVKERSCRMGEIIRQIGQIDFELDNAQTDVLGDAYEYMIGQFASGAGKKGGEFYTPQAVSTVLAKIVAHERPKMGSVYDPTCGSGSLLLRVAHETNREGDIRIKGQELNTTTFNLARMNMILHGVRWTNFDIRNGDTLTNDLFTGETFDAIVANPPYSLKWTHTDGLAKDERFSAVGKLPPKDKADYAFVEHIIHHLAEDGVAAVVLPHGVLFRGGAEGLIRKHLIESNLVHAVMGLPENLFYGTGIPTCVVVFKKGRADDDGVLFVDASLSFEKGKNQNLLRDDDVDDIVNTYVNRVDVDRVAHVADVDEVKSNDYNLNLTRYVDSSEPEEIIDLDETKRKIRDVSEHIAHLEASIAESEKELLG